MANGTGLGTTAERPTGVYFALGLFSRLLTCFVMERTFFEDFRGR